MRIIQLFKKYKFPILLTLATRIGYSLWLAIIWFVVDKYYPLTPVALRENYYSLTRSTTLIGRSFIDVWLRWDAVHYMNIAAFGYKGVGTPDTVFFPLYPYFVGIVSKITTINVTLIGILVSSLFTLFALIYLYDLVKLLFNDETLAKLSIMLLALYPTAFFLHAPFTDAMFLFCTIACVFYLERKKFIIGSIFACAAGLIRPQGILLLLPICISLIQEHVNQKQPIHWREILSIVIAPLGFVFYSIWRSIYGQPGIIQSLQEYSNVRFQDPFSTLIKEVISLIKQPSIIQATELIFVLFFLFVLIWMFLRKEFRKHLGIMLYSAATWLLIVSKTTVNGSPPRLSNRYILYIFFAFVGIGFLIRKIPDKAQKFIFFSLIVLSMVSLTLYSLWIYIG
jgi:Gpi18-like mannosyltransferase